MMVILKIPMIAALCLVWWAIKQEPEPEEEHRRGARPAPQAAAASPLAAPRPGGRRSRLQDRTLPAELERRHAHSQRSERRQYARRVEN